MGMILTGSLVHSDCIVFSYVNRKSSVLKGFVQVNEDLVLFYRLVQVEAGVSAVDRLQGTHLCPCRLSLSVRQWRMPTELIWIRIRNNEGSYECGCFTSLRVPYKAGNLLSFG
jgi:hypothetical protein